MLYCKKETARAAMTKHTVRRRTSDNSRSTQPDRIQKDDCRAFLPPEEQYERIFVVKRYNKRKLFDFFKKIFKKCETNAKKKRLLW